MIIQPILAPAASGLTVTPTLRGNVLLWDQNDGKYTEVWGSTTNNRSAATKLRDVFDNSHLHVVDSGTVWYYWIRVFSIYGRPDGPWFPVSATAGVSSSSALAQTADIAPNAATNIILRTDTATISQTVYDTWTTTLKKYFYGSGPIGFGNPALMTVQSDTRTNLVTIGTTGYAQTEQRMKCVQFSCYKIGTISTTAGSPIVTGTGTAWLSSALVAAGNILHIPDSVDGLDYVISTRDSDTQVTLTTNATTTTSGQAYFIRVLTSNPIFQLDQANSRYEIRGAYLASFNYPYSHRWSNNCVEPGLVYLLSMEWRMVRSDPSWSISQDSFRRMILIEDIKL